MKFYSFPLLSSFFWEALMIRLRSVEFTSQLPIVVLSREGKRVLILNSSVMPLFKWFKKWWKICFKFFVKKPTSSSDQPLLGKLDLVFLEGLHLPLSLSTSFQKGLSRSHHFFPSATFYPFVFFFPYLFF